MKLAVRPPVARGSVRRRRVAASLAARVTGATIVVVAAAALYWLTGAEAFSLDPARVHLSGLIYTGEQQVRDAIGLSVDARPNVFRLRPAQMADALRGLPSVASADVEVSLPDTLDITVVERQPLLVWQTAHGAWLVDASGELLAPAPGSVGLPAVDDRRTSAASLGPGTRLDDVDLAAARLLLTISPSDLGSASTGLALAVDDADGWYVTSAQPAWRAIFGFYTTNQLRPADRVPQQRQCLASLLAQDHEQPATIWLAVAGDVCGTYRAEPTPAGYSVQNVGQWLR